MFHSIDFRKHVFDKLSEKIIIIIIFFFVVVVVFYLSWAEGS